MGARGSKGSKGYVILSFRVHTTSVGAWGEQEEVRGEGSERARASKGVRGQGVCYARF